MANDKDTKIGREASQSASRGWDTRVKDFVKPEGPRIPDLNQEKMRAMQTPATERAPTISGADA